MSRRKSSSRSIAGGHVEIRLRGRRQDVAAALDRIARGLRIDWAGEFMDEGKFGRRYVAATIVPMPGIVNALKGLFADATTAASPGERAEAGGDEKLIDPDCRDGKCGSCVGGPCEHSCHQAGGA